MPEPLIAKRPPVASWPVQAAVFIIAGVPLLALMFCFQHGIVIHFDNPSLNLGVHVGLFVLPIIWVGALYSKPVVYECPPGESVLGSSTYFSRLPANWWMMFMMWATPVLALLLLGHAFFTRYLPHPEELSTSPGKALAILITLTGLGTFYGALVLGRSQPPTRISEAGLRISILRFYEWKNIHHLSQYGDLYALYDRANPALPANAFKVKDQEARALLERYLTQNQIRIQDEPSTAFAIVKLCVVLGFIGIIAFCLWLRSYFALTFISTVLISFGVGIVLTVLLEKYRGVSKYGRSVPVISNQESEQTINRGVNPLIWIVWVIIVILLFVLMVIRRHLGSN